MPTEQDTTAAALVKVRAYITHNPFDADEIAWICSDASRAEVAYQRIPSPYEECRRVYMLEVTPELRERFAAMSNEEFKASGLLNTAEFTYRNAGLKSIDRIAVFAADG